MGKILTLNTRYISGSSLFHSHTSLIFIARPRELHTICNVLAGRRREGESFVFLSFFLATQIKQQVVALFSTGQRCPFCFHIANTNCSRRFFLSQNTPQLSPSFTMGLWLKFVFAQPTCRRRGGRGLLKGVANHTLVFAH